MKTIINYSLILFIFTTFMISCSDLEENYSKYLEDIKYSSKVDTLKGEIGVEKVHLTWSSPKDKVAKKIRVEYGDGLYIETDKIVSSITIENLTSPVGYNFAVYSLDAFGNKSVGSTIFLTPVTQTYIKSYMSRITSVQPKYSIEDNKLTIRWIDLSENAFLRYTGQINYTYTINGISYSGNSNTGNINEESVIIPDITSPVNIDFNYTMSYRPIIGNNILLDTIPKSENAKLVIEYSTGDIIEKIDGSIINRYFGIPFDNSTEFSANYLFKHLFDGSNSDNNSWVSSSPGYGTYPANEENGYNWPLSFTIDLSDKKDLTHIEIMSWENFSQAPKRFDVWGTDAVDKGKPQAYWTTTIPGEWQNDWYKLAVCDVVNPTLPGYKFAINPEKKKTQFIRIVIHEVFKPTNHVRVGMSELTFYERLAPKLVVK